MKLVLSNYVAQQQNAVANTLSEFIKEAAKQGFNLVQPKGGTPVFLSKAGNPQLLLKDKDEKRIYLRISSNLDSALRAKEPGIDLTKAPVYHVDLENVGGTGGKGHMLVIGMAAEAQEFEVVDMAKLNTYVRPEPA